MPLLESEDDIDFKQGVWFVMRFVRVFPPG